MTFKTIFFNRYFDKNRLKSLILWSLKKSGEKKTIELLEKLKDVGFQYATKAGLSLGIDDLKIPPNKANLITEAETQILISRIEYEKGHLTHVERFQQMIDIWNRTSETLKQSVIENFRSTDILNPVYMMAFSGARGNISQVRQLVGMRGLMADPQGQILEFPIKSNFREGLTLTEYIISCFGARKGLVDTALRTANSGYLTRRLVDVSQHIIVRQLDCGTERGIFLTDMKDGKKTILKVENRIIGRVLAEDIEDLAKRNQDISPALAANIAKIKKSILVRSPLTCEAKKSICQLCYGWSLAHGNLVSLGEAVGILAAQSIGEPGTQLTMRTFHTGGVFSADAMDEIRAPFDGHVTFSEALQGILIRTIHGKIAFLTKIEGNFSITSSVDSSKLNYSIPSSTVLFIRQNEKVFKHQLLAEYSSIFISKNQSIQSKYNVHSNIEGEVFFENVNLALKKGKDGDRVRTAIKFGSLWVLSGKIYHSLYPSSLYPKINDIVDKNSIMSQISLVSPYSGKIQSNLNSRRPKNFQNNIQNFSLDITKQFLIFPIKNIRYKKFVYFINLLNFENDKFLFFNSINYKTSKTDTPEISLKAFPEIYKIETGGFLLGDRRFLNNSKTKGLLFFLKEESYILRPNKNQNNRNKKGFTTYKGIPIKKQHLSNKNEQIIKFNPSIDFHSKSKSSLDSNRKGKDFVKFQSLITNQSNNKDENSISSKLFLSKTSQKTFLYKFNKQGIKRPLYSKTSGIVFLEKNNNNGIQQNSTFEQKQDFFILDNSFQNFITQKYENPLMRLKKISNSKIYTFKKKIINEPIPTFRKKIIENLLRKNSRNTHLKTSHLNKRYKSNFFLNGNKTSEIRLKIKSGWIYFLSSVDYFLNYNEKIFFPGSKIFNTVLFDQQYIHIQLVSNTIDFSRKKSRNTFTTNKFRWTNIVFKQKIEKLNYLTIKNEKVIKSICVQFIHLKKYEKNRISKLSRKPSFSNAQNFSKIKYFFLIQKISQFTILNLNNYKKLIYQQGVKFNLSNNKVFFTKQQKTKLLGSPESFYLESKIDIEKYLEFELLNKQKIYFQVGTTASDSFRKKYIKNSSYIFEIDFTFHQLNKSCFCVNHIQFNKPRALTFSHIKDIKLLQFMLKDSKNINFEQNIHTKNYIFNQLEILEKNSVILTSFLTPYEGEITKTKLDNTDREKKLIVTNVDKISFYLNCEKSNVKIGQLIRYGEEITNGVGVRESGQVIQIDQDKITLRKAVPILFSSKGMIHVDHNDLVEKNTPLVTLFYEQLKTGDIVQGIPKIEELFEARQTKEGEELRENLHIKLKQLFEMYKQQVTPQEAARISIEKIQQILINSVQQVYQSQGVTIADKHIEIIVRQMTAKVKIIDGGRTGLLRGELIDLEWVETVNLGIEAQNVLGVQGFELEKAEYEPIILGITKAALETESFISAASFQETTRILGQAAIERKTDFLRGLKENVILGHLIPAGTGFSLSFDPQIKVSGVLMKLSWLNYNDMAKLLSKNKQN